MRKSRHFCFCGDNVEFAGSSEPTTLKRNIMDITAEELKSRIDNGEKPFIIDVREEPEYNEDNIGGVLIPLGSLPHNLDELEEYKDEEVIVQCRSGARSATAKAFLEQNGFQNVRNLLGGILAYREIK